MPLVDQIRPIDQGPADRKIIEKICFSVPILQNRFYQIALSRFIFKSDRTIAFLDGQNRTSLRRILMTRQLFPSAVIHAE